MLANALGVALSVLDLELVSWRYIAAEAEESLHAHVPAPVDLAGAVKALLGHVVLNVDPGAKGLVWVV